MPIWPFSLFFGGRNKVQVKETPEQRRANCLHPVLKAHWDSVADMGHEEKAEWSCVDCGKKITRAERDTIKARQQQ